MGTSTRDPKTDPQPGDTVTIRGETYTVYDREGDGNSLTVNVSDHEGAVYESYAVSLEEWSDLVEDGTASPFYLPDAAAPAGSDPSPLDRLGTDAATLVTLLRAAALAAAPGTPQYARDAAEGWLRGVFAATYGTAADAPATEWTVGGAS